MLGIGTDILELPRVAGVIERSGDRLAQRILAPEELARVNALDVRIVGKAFAAKEAIAKALGTGFRGGIGWQDIRIDRDALGRPTVSLHGKAHERLLSMGGSHVLLSISDERHYVVAFAAIT